MAGGLSPALPPSVQSIGVGEEETWLTELALLIGLPARREALLLQCDVSAACLHRGDYIERCGITVTLSSNTPTHLL